MLGKLILKSLPYLLTRLYQKLKYSFVASVTTLSARSACGLILCGCYLLFLQVLEVGVAASSATLATPGALCASASSKTLSECSCFVLSSLGHLLAFGLTFDLLFFAPYNTTSIHCSTCALTYTTDLTDYTCHC